MKRRQAVAALLIGLCAACQVPSHPRPASTSLVRPSTLPGGWHYTYVGAELGGELWDLAATGPDSAWAVGAKGGKAFLLEYDGRTWRPADLPEGLGEVERKEDLRLAAAGRDDLWLFRPDPRRTRVFRRDGTGWHELPAYPWQAIDVRVFAPGDVWLLAGDRRAGHWDGTRWRTRTLPAHASALGAAAPDDMWAVGHRDTGTGPYSQPAAMHWNGRAWRLTPTPAYRFPDPRPPEEETFLYDVVVPSGKEAWAVGVHTFNHGEGGQDPADPPPVVLRWNGSAWNRHLVPIRATCCLLLAPDGTGGVLLGTTFAGISNTWRLTADGAVAELPKMRMPRGQIGDLTAMTHVPGTHTVLAVGTLRARGAPRITVAEFDADEE
ncbi:hypothetical protein [Nonomuraea jiangxiensis]|uniref:Uncharacterized protein n=1 Tax=Nonomuraea jiangxiensis TaxID=633440 RepID=A0A1G8CGM1_9ACTN|nr:hypothetical protein [Nonomuraea jiangxiensis]SDH44626.1 hypothetical protein SAMN05421869_102293 [Nonomuraea jiangxiensis]